MNCPSCGAELKFKSSVSVFCVCPYCASMIVRHGMDLENLGKMAQLPPDLSPLQIGSSGKYGGESFIVVGRLRLAWEDGGWNEWHLLMSDGRSGWLAEAQGFWMMSFEVQGAKGVPSPKSIKVGETWTLQLPSSDGKKLVLGVDDIKRVRCVASEGELPFAAPHGRKSQSIDLSGPGDLFATADFGEGEEPRLYVGRYVELPELKPQGLRTLDGW